MKNKKIANNFLKIIPIYWAMNFDYIITLIQQPKGFWKGNLLLANEVNPIGKMLLKTNMYAVVIGALIWLFLVALIGLNLPEKYARIFFLFIFITHSWGAASWIVLGYGFWQAIL